MRIGILGGTFNPVHKGHLALAEQALRKLDLDKVLFVPAYIPPHKKLRDKITPSGRLEMLRIALAGRKKVEISAYEIRKKGRSYTIDTARHLVKKYGRKSKFFFLVGADEIAGLKKWRDVNKLKKLVSFAAFTRPGVKTKSGFRDVLIFALPPQNISSTLVRRLAKSGKPVGRLVPKGVSEYIKRNKLYA